MFGLTALGVVPWLLYITAFPTAIDAHAYYVGEYGQLGAVDAYLYSPAFSQAIEPLRWLGWDGFRTTWRGLEVVALAATAGPLTGPLIFVHPVALEVNLGNIHILLTAAIVAGFRYPATWAFVLLTKVTPGVGLLWFAVRREWRSLAIALAATGVISAVSFAMAPDDWGEWLSSMAAQTTKQEDPLLITAPLWLRLPAAGALVAWGARTDRRWTVLIGAFLALPLAWYAGTAMFIGLLALLRRGPVPVAVRVGPTG
jgi:hypothetical protein